MGATTSILCSNESLLDAVRADSALSDSVTALSDQDVIDWANDINTNPQAAQRHLKPDNRDLTTRELRDHFSCFIGHIPVVQFDCAYGRTSESVMGRLMLRALDHLPSIQAIKGSYREWWERCGIEDTEANRRRFLPLSLKCKERFWPRLAPLRGAFKPPPYVRSYPLKNGSGGEIRIVLSNVTWCELIRAGEFFDEYDNPEFADANGNKYLKTPLVPLGRAGRGVTNNIYNALRRHTDISEERFYRDWFG